MHGFAILSCLGILISAFLLEQNAPLTVIRAENGSGKTSVLQALRWAFYGAKALDDLLVRISPADWPDGEPCTISVEIEFSHTLVSTVGDRASYQRNAIRAKAGGH